MCRQGRHAKQPLAHAMVEWAAMAPRMYRSTQVQPLTWQAAGAFLSSSARSCT